MSITLGRRLARIEEERTARALADFRAAFHDWALRPDLPQTQEEAEARLAAMGERLSPEERDQAEHLAQSLEALIEPATPPAAIARAAAVFATGGAYGLQRGDPCHVVLAALAAHFRAAD